MPDSRAFVCATCGKAGQSRHGRWRPDGWYELMAIKENDLVSGEYYAVQEAWHWFFCSLECEQRWRKDHLAEVRRFS